MVLQSWLSLIEVDICRLLRGLWEEHTKYLMLESPQAIWQLLV